MTRLLVLTLLLALPAQALDKQGSAHGGGLEGPSSGFGFSGSLMAAVSFYNPTYAARPDNTGLALMRYAAHADVDLVGRRLSVPIDVNVFSDRLREGAAKLAPSEVDVIVGLTSTWRVGPGALEVGSRVEHDRPVDQGTFTQTYVDARARFLFAFAASHPGLSGALGGGDLAGWLTLGWFAYNPSYAARPDNTGLALFRYAAHAELTFWQARLGVALDATMFTDRQATALRPSELDLTPEFILHLDPWEVHLAYERDMPLDRSGLVQSFAFVLAAWAFDATAPQSAPPPRDLRREKIHSP